MQAKVPSLARSAASRRFRLRRRGSVVLVVLWAFAIAAVIAFGQYNWVVMLVIVTLMGVDHPPIRDDGQPLGALRTALGIASFLIPIVTFMPEPLRLK